MAKQSGLKTSKLEELENNLGDALCQAGLAKKKYSRGAVQPVYEEWKERNLYQLLKAKFKSPSASATNFSTSTERDSFRRLNLELDNSSYNQIIQILDSNKGIDLGSYPMLDLLKKAKNDAEKIRIKEVERERASPPLAIPPNPWQSFADGVLGLGKKEEKVSKAVSGWESFAGGLLSNLSRVKEIFTSEEEKRKIAQEELKKIQAEELRTKERKEIERKGSFFNGKTPKQPKTNVKIRDRAYALIHKIESENQLSSKELSSNPKNYLFQRKAMWNEYLGQFGIKNKSIETNSDLGDATLSYIQFLKTNIKQLENKNDDAKILSGFLQLELKKIEYMFLGEEIIPESNGPRPFQQTEPFISKVTPSPWPSHHVRDAYRGFKEIASAAAQYSGISKIGGIIGEKPYEHDPRDGLGPIWYSESLVSDKMYEATYKVKSKMLSKISEESQETILEGRYLVGEIKALGEDERKFLDKIKLPNRIPDSLTGNYKQRIQQELSFKIGSSSYSNSTPKPTPTPTLEKAKSLPSSGVGSIPSNILPPLQMKKSASLPATPSNSPSYLYSTPYQRDEVEKVLTKIRSKKFSSSDLVKVVDKRLDLSGGMFKRASEIDKAIGVMDRNNLSQDNSLAQELRGYKQSFSYDSRDSGFKFGERSGENAYAYICFLGSRIKLLQEASKHLEFSKPDLKNSIHLREIATDNEKLQDHKSQLKTIKKMQANLLLELARFEVGLTPKDNFNTKESIGYSQRVSINSGTPNPLGPIHVEPQVQLQKRKMITKILGNLAGEISPDRLGINYSLDYSVPVSNPAKNPVKKELEAVIRNSRLLMGISSQSGMTR